MMRCAPLAVLVLLIAACSGSTTTFGGEDLFGDAGNSDDGGGGGSTDSGGGSSDGSSGGGGDATVADAGTVREAGGKEGGGGGGGEVLVTINVTNFSENCMPIVSDDPVTVLGSITVQNNRKVSVGPISLSGGAFLDTTGKQVATFDVKPSTLAAVAPGATGTLSVEKVTPSMSPSEGCGTLKCDAKYMVQVTMTAPSFPSYNAKTVPIAIACAL
jgi:hypothetical protein